LSAPPDPPSRKTGGLFLRGGEGREGKGIGWDGRGGKGREKEGTGKEGRRRERRGKEGERGREGKREGDAPPPNADSWIRTWFPLGYQKNVLRKDRTDRGGGVFLAFKEGYVISRVEGTTNCEGVWAEIYSSLYTSARSTDHRVQEQNRVKN